MNDTIDFSIDQQIFSIRKDGEVLGHIEMEDGEIITSGFIGNNTYDNWIELLQGLQGFDIGMDNLYN